MLTQCDSVLEMNLAMEKLISYFRLLIVSLSNATWKDSAYNSISKNSQSHPLAI